MTTRTLPGDVARCSGIGSDEEGWYEECETCLRRTSPPTDHPMRPYMVPPAVITFFCPSYVSDK